MDNDKEYTITYSGDDGSIDGCISTPYAKDVDGTYTINLSEYNATHNIDTTFAPSYTFEDLDTGPGKWPSEYDLEKMIEMYPALKIQYTKFIEVYNLVKDDYKGRKNDDIPF